MYKIITDSACDIKKEYLDRHNTGLVPLYVTFDGENYVKEQIEIGYDEFYDKMINDGAFPKSSLPSVSDYIDAFMPYVKSNTPIIVITITTLFSGSYNSACTAKDTIIEDYPDAEITVINSLQNSASMSLFVYEAIRMQENGVSYDDCVRVLNDMKAPGRIFFTVESLDYLKKGGRIGKVATAITGKLSIRPIIVMKNGEISLGGIARTRSKAKNNVIEIVRKHIADNNIDINKYDFTVGYCTNLKEAEEYRSTVEEALGIKLIESQEQFDTRIGIVTACHTGPYAIGIACMPKYETLL
ncbi:MAG: DegV family protein [Eubacteriales bacterium]|nr:DegV family protein [Eubacteriales bacterium]